MRLLILIFLFSFCSLELIASDENASTSTKVTKLNLSVEELAQVEQKKRNIIALAKKVETEKIRKKTVQQYLKSAQEIEKIIAEDKVWTKSYVSYLTSLEVRNNLRDIKNRIKYLSRHSLNENDKDELNALVSKEMILTSQIEKLKRKNSAPFSQLITPPVIDEIPSITNPFDVFTGISFTKNLSTKLEEYEIRKTSLTKLIMLLRKENRLYTLVSNLDKEKKYEKVIKYKKTELERFETALDTIKATSDVYEKRLELIEINVNKDIQAQIVRLTKIGIVIVIVFLFFLLVKFIIKKYIKDHERVYMANKVITFTNFTIIILILFFNYIENAGYLVTILGFASAGIAIAMKDWFMSILGWLVIVFGGSIHVGDRIRVDMDGMKYVGDVMDISLLRMTILEDITLTSIISNRRAGRIIFVPNNYIFTRMIANYTHSSLKTVWDGIKITITYDSNHKKAMYLAKEITRKYSKGYTDITRNQLNKLRNNYSLKNTNVDVRIYSFIVPHGLDIESWYLTNAYATLTLRSSISTEIVDAFNAEDDITIAYPTQKLNVSMQSEQPTQHNHEMV